MGNLMGKIMATLKDPNAWRKCCKDEAPDAILNIYPILNTSARDSSPSGAKIYLNKYLLNKFKIYKINTFISNVCEF
jgi:hypothetical protein